MKSLPHLLLTCLVLASLASFARSQQNEDTLVLENYGCRVTLPNSDWQWSDPTRFPKAVAALKDNSGTMLLVLAEKIPPGLAFDDSFIKSYEESLLKPGVVTQIDKEFTTFLGVRCYQTHLKVEQKGTFATFRVFAANGTVYILELIGSRRSVEEQAQLEPFFSAFSFIGNPTTADPPATSALQSGHSFSQSMGTISAIILMAALAVAVVRWLIRRGKPRPEPPL